MDTPERRVSLQIILVFTLTCPKPFTGGHVSVFDKLFTLISCECKIYICMYIYTATR